MKSVRIFYRKEGLLRYVSHLDMNRLFTRVLRRADLPLWYTEGFNPRPRLQFALPLSLGWESDWEIVDVRLDDDAFPNEEVHRRLAAAAPTGLTVFRVADPVRKPGEVAFARFAVKAALPDVTPFFAQSEILSEKKTKKGSMKTVDIRPWIADWSRTADGLLLTLAAGQDNLSPALVLEAMGAFFGAPIAADSIRRTMLLDAEKRDFV
ncbi:MAG: DUF2344 domain-containing protein [Clostridia bacterium]|nr:DUF2344 domain-containing protein [Clostridia bacterium]